MEKLRSELQSIFGEARVRINESLDHYIPQHSVSASLFLVVNSKDELVTAISLARQYKVPFCLIDQESEKLSENKEFVGLVVKNNARKFDILARKGKIRSQQLITAFALVEAESGASFNGLVRFTIDEGLGGLEEGIGISGSVGRVIATDEEVISSLKEQQIVQSVTILTPEDEIQDISLEDYKSGLIVLSIIFKLLGEDKKILWLKAKHAAQKRGIQDLTVLS